MAQNEPQRKETPPGPSPNSPPLLFEYQCRSGKFIRLPNRIESKLFCPNWNALTATVAARSVNAHIIVLHSQLVSLLLAETTDIPSCRCPSLAAHALKWPYCLLSILAMYRVGHKNRTVFQT